MMEIGLAELVGIVWRGRWLIAAVTVAFCIASAVCALLFKPGRRRDDCIAGSGDLTVDTDGKRVDVVRANGAVVSGEGSSKWFRRSTMDIRPGATIVLPLDVDRVPALARWQSSTTILYNLTIGIAALGSL